MEKWYPGSEGSAFVSTRVLLAQEGVQPPLPLLFLRSLAFLSSAMTQKPSVGANTRSGTSQPPAPRTKWISVLLQCDYPVLGTLVPPINKGYVPRSPVDP